MLLGRLLENAYWPHFVRLLNAQQPWGDTGSMDWDLLEGLGLLKKGVILSILWADGFKRNHQLVRQIAGSDQIYSLLDSQGPRAVWKLMEQEESSMVDAMVLVLGAKADESLRAWLNLGNLADSASATGTVWQLLCYGSNYVLATIAALVRTKHSDLDISGETRLRWQAANEIITAASTTAPYNPAVDFPPAQPEEGTRWFAAEDDGQIIQQVQARLRWSRCYRDAEVLRVLGRGGYGVVLEIKQNQERYALKFMVTSKDSIRERLTRAASITHWMQSVGGFHSVVIDQEFNPDSHYFVQRMHLIPTTLRQAVLQRQNLRPVFWALFRQVQLLHSYGVFHLDIKPENIGITEDSRVYLMDLDQLTTADQQGMVAGSPDSGATPEFSSIGCVRSMTGEATEFCAQLHDYAGLALSWLYYRLGQAGTSLFRKKIDQFKPELAGIYQHLSQVDLNKQDRLNIVQVMFAFLKDDQDNLRSLFSQAHVELQPFDQELLQQLYLSATSSDPYTSTLLNDLWQPRDYLIMDKQDQLVPWLESPTAAELVRSKPASYWLVKIARIFINLRVSHQQGTFWPGFKVEIAHLREPEEQLNLRYYDSTAELDSDNLWDQIQANITSLALLARHLLSAIPDLATKDPDAAILLALLQGLAVFQPSLSEEMTLPTVVTPDEQAYMAQLFQHESIQYYQMIELYKSFLLSLYNYLNNRYAGRERFRKPIGKQ